MYDALDFARDIDTLKYFKLHSKEDKILTDMMNDVYASCEIFKLYAEPQMCTLSSSASLAFANILLSGKRMLSLGGELDRKITDLSNALVQRRRAFLDQTAISMSDNTYQILVYVENISNQVSDHGR